MIRQPICWSLTVVAACLFTAVSFADDELTRRASWSQPTSPEVRAELDKWLADKKPTDAEKRALEALWPKEGAPAADLLDHLAASIAVVEPAAREILAVCQGDTVSASAPKFALLADEKTPDFVKNNLRLLYGRW